MWYNDIYLNMKNFLSVLCFPSEQCVVLSSTGLGFFPGPVPWLLSIALLPELSYSLMFVSRSLMSDYLEAFHCPFMGKANYCLLSPSCLISCTLWKKYLEVQLEKERIPQFLGNDPCCADHDSLRTSRSNTKMPSYKMLEMIQQCVHSKCFQIGQT